jgi:molybdate transport system ATP-binding protein
MKLRLESIAVRRGRRIVLDIPGLVLPLDGVTAVMGPNGSGKTTLLRVIAGLEREGDGTARLETETAQPRRPTVALAFQRAPFLQGTVRSNLELALELRRVPRPEWPARLGRAAGLLGVEHLLDRHAGGLSGGEAQRANVARALAVPADLVLLDEPFAGLDGPSSRELLRLLPHALAEAGVPVMLVTHQPAEALRLARRAVVLQDGRVAAAGPLPDLFRDPPGRAVAEIAGFALLPDGDDPGAVPVATQLDEGPAVLDEGPAVLDGKPTGALG